MIHKGGRKEWDQILGSRIVLNKVMWCLSRDIFFFFVRSYEWLFDSGLMSVVDASDWGMRKMAEASDIGIMQRALD